MSSTLKLDETTNGPSLDPWQQMHHVTAGETAVGRNVTNFFHRNVNHVRY